MTGWSLRVGRRSSLLVMLACSPPVWAEQGPASFEFYGKLYPEWKVQEFGDPARAGATVGHLGTLRNDRIRLTADARDKDDTSDQEWSNSYVGIRGHIRHGDLGLGYDIQALIDLAGDGSLLQNFRDNLGTRDAFVYIESPGFGRLAFGKMDSLYKDWGDRLGMFGVASSNIVSTSKVLSGTAWRAGGDATFHNRRSHTLSWTSPSWSGVEVGLAHSFDEYREGPGGPDTTLSAAALRWRGDAWYVALATEHHRDWLPMSLGAEPGPESIKNRPESTGSNDQAWRLSVEWRKGPWRLAADVASLGFKERDAAAQSGKFRDYRNTTWQMGAEYKLTDTIRIAANHARAGKGHCNLSGGVACVTDGLGGWQTSLGVLLAVNKDLSAFALAVHIENGTGGSYASAPQGADVDAYALGLKYVF